MDDLLNVEGLDSADSGKSITFTKRVRSYKQAHSLVFNRTYIESQGIHFEDNGDLTFGVNFKASPVLIVFNLSESSLAKGKGYIAKAPKKGYSPFINSKALFEKLVTYTGMDLDSEVKHWDFRLEFVADNEVGKWFRLIPDAR